MVTRYEEALGQPIQGVLSLHLLLTISEVYQRALVVEWQQQHRSVVCTYGGCHSTDHSIALPRTSPLQSLVNPNPSIRFFRWGESAHRALDCQKPASQKGKNLMIGETGVEEATENGKATYDEDDSNDVLHGDSHETLVIRKSLLTPKA